ncbi:barstar family protein [Acidovorax sp. SUPP950]|uniref:barstar family protein n=1 Tax=Acidovorax sp. SUPP950 TaxID=511901 RepID=UPI0023BECB0E|nr:barstar family protein [Acidovorax sp. SUPP950]GKS73318.1 barstar family protein [Acidovorax sp. SUPP950]
MTVRKDEVTVDLRGVATPEELQAQLMKLLDFPGWYGMNWNAFWDAITGLVEMPLRLRFVGWADFELRQPFSANQLRECLSQMQTELPTLAAAVSYE